MNMCKGVDTSLFPLKIVAVLSLPSKTNRVKRSSAFRAPRKLVHFANLGESTKITEMMLW